MDVATDVRDVMDETGTIAWAAASRGERPPQGFPISNPKTKDLARQLLIEGINNDLVADYYNANNCLIIWDISDLIALLLAARGEMDVEQVREAVAKKALKDAIALLTSSYQQTARFYPLSMAEYKKLKVALEKWIP